MQYIVEANNQGIVTLTLNKPKSLNTLCGGLMTEMLETLDRLAQDENTAALIITGSGRAFCAGADLSGGPLASDTVLDQPLGELVAAQMESHFNPLMEAIYNFPRPVITAVNGVAAGGGVGLALCADLIVISKDAGFRVVQLQQLGIAADLGANWLLARLAGRGRALAMCMLGDTIPAAQLKEWGLVWECAAPEALLDLAAKRARKLSGLSSEALIATRRLVDEANTSSFEKSLFDEKEAQRTLCSEPVFLNSVKAFFAAR